MTDPKDLIAETDAVEATEALELNDAALDQASGATFYGRGVYKTTDGGLTW